MEYVSNFNNVNYILLGISFIVISLLAVSPKQNGLFNEFEMTIQKIHEGSKYLAVTAAIGMGYNLSVLNNHTYSYWAIVYFACFVIAFLGFYFTLRAIEFISVINLTELKGGATNS